MFRLRVVAFAAWSFAATVWLAGAALAQDPLGDDDDTGRDDACHRARHR